MNPVFSIIIPTYNSEATLKHCIDSITTQLFTNIEILVIDGFSDDGTVSIAKNYNDVRIRIICEKDNGIYDAMNKGIQLAKGDWLYFLGSDDSLFDDKVLANFQGFTKMTSSDFIYGKVLFKNSNKVYGEIFTLRKLLFEKNLCHQSIFYKRRVFELNGLYDIEYKLWADWEYNCRCFRNNNIKTLFYDKLVSVYNDGLGYSGQNEDQIFKKELPVFYIYEIDQLQTELSIIKSRFFYKLDYTVRKFIKAISNRFNK